MYIYIYVFAHFNCKNKFPVLFKCTLLRYFFNQTNVSNVCGFIILVQYIKTMKCWGCVRSYLRLDTRVFLPIIISKPVNDIISNFDSLLSLINCTTYQNFRRFHLMDISLSGKVQPGQFAKATLFLDRKAKGFFTDLWIPGLASTCIPWYPPPWSPPCSWRRWVDTGRLWSRKLNSCL